MSHRKVDKYYRPDGASIRKFAQDSNRIAEMLRRNGPPASKPAPVTIKEPKK